MSSSDDIAASFEELKHGVARGRISHAYLITGDPRGNGAALAKAFLQLLYCSGASKPCGVCSGCVQAGERLHPDIHWMEPKSRSRVIVVAEIRDLITQINQTPFIAGGWKAGVILYADRMNDAAQNAFLKTLEEPPGRSIFLLVTDMPQALLPTIISRCQRVAAAGRKELDERWDSALMEILRKGAPQGSLDAFYQASLLSKLLKEIKDSIEEEEPEENDDGSEEPDDNKDAEVEGGVMKARVKSRLLEIQASLFQKMQLWNRDVLVCRMGGDLPLLHFPGEIGALREQAGRLTHQQALARVEAVEDMARRLSRHIPDDVNLPSGLFSGMPARGPAA